MTTTTVSQEAREAYLSMNMLPEFDAADVRAGRWDNTTGLQAFAKFEQSIRQSAERGEVVATAFTATVGIRRQTKTIESVDELLRLINGGAILTDVRRITLPTPPEAV